MSIEIDEEWLNSPERVYPVVVDPSFGYTTKGMSGDYQICEKMAGGKYPSGGAGTLESITGYMSSYFWGVFNGNQRFGFAIYEDGVAGVKVDVTNEHTILGTENDGWFLLTFLKLQQILQTKIIGCMLGQVLVLLVF